AQRELARWCAAATLVAVPSYNESFGLVAAEAQAAGTPVVAAAVGGLTMVVDHEVSGLLVDSHEAEDWAAALSRVVESEPLQAKLADGALAQAAGFSWERTAERTVEVYQRARLAMLAPGLTPAI
ncbi:MAG: glycosyltransferase, partial [Nocardioides sp.]